jgi:hypothetical protein
VTERLYDVYVSKHKITGYREGAVYSTLLLETGWFPQEDVNANIPDISGILYAAASDEFASTHMTIRTRKNGGIT